MKSSLYNYSFHLPDETYLIYNFYTLTLIALQFPESKIAQEILDYPNTLSVSKRNSALKKLLAEKGFIIDDSIDEIELLRISHLNARTQKSHMGLTIVPTLSCNFQCRYCYETGNRQTMDRDVETALLDLVRRRIPKGRHLSVTWFGGEPLLRMDIIERLSRGLIKICEDNKVKYSANMITNGYLLNPKNVHNLRLFKINSVQITIDGPPDIHDQRRPLKKGGKTFKKIFENLKEASLKISVRLRMNVDEDNREKIREMLDILSRESLNKNVGFYLGQTYPYTSACGDIAGLCLSDEDFSLLGLETMMEMVQRGFSSTFNLPKKKDQHCLADSGNSLVITPSGRIVNCWNDVDNPNATTGHLLEPETSETRKNLATWKSRDPFSFECKDCLLLPICMGGCPYIHLHTGKLHCHKWKYNLKESIAFYYFLKKIKQQSEIIREFQQAVENIEELAAMSQRNAHQKK